MNKFQHMTLWQYWKRGFVTLSCVYIVCAVPLSAGVGVLKLLAPWPILQSVCGLLVFAFWIIATPVLLSWSRVLDRNSSEHLAIAIHGHLDQMAVQVGVNWEGHYLLEVDRLLQQRRFNDAKKLYHDAANATWDEASRAIGDWAGTVLIKKLEILRQHLPDSTVAK